MLVILGETRDSGCAWRKACRPVDVVDYAHVDDSLTAVGGEFGSAADGLDEGAQLMRKRRVAGNRFGLFSGARLHDELMTAMRRDWVRHAQLPELAARH